MKTLKEIKAMDRKQRNALLDELYALIETNDTEKVKGFLQEYPLQESFYEENIEDEDKDKFSLFQVERVLAKAAVAYEKYKDPAMLEFLQEWGLRIDHHSKFAENALTEYIEQDGGEDEMVIKYLVDKGLTCEKRDEDSGFGWTCMHRWAMGNNYKALKIAITKAGANVDIKDRLRETPLFAAVKESSNYKATQLLIELGANVNYYDGAFTPLDKAQGAKNKKLLKDAGAKSARSFRKIEKEAHLVFGVDLDNRENYDETYDKLTKEQHAEINKLVNQKITEMMSKKKDK
ncbi:ankyrin repeat domain-containing protein [Helicobacter rodentium]|uniref:ankyrin repeat domain-containing protein n=1 Tax=Helicobacter rodentium TaxID=59617 RepID=UPI0025A64939|nr:ankyrin repeat domain-containing protein [Helicobacter rodentium]